MTEPGTAFARRAISLKPKADKQLIDLAAHLEQKLGKRLSLSEVVRMSIACLAEKEGM